MTMTLMNAKLIKTILFATIIVAMMIPVSAGNLGVVFAENKTKFTKDQYLGLIEKHKSQLTKELTKSELDKIDGQVKLDKKVQALTTSESLRLDGYSYYGNLAELESNPNAVLDIIMHYTENGKSLTVLVDGATNGVLDLQERPIGEPLLPTNGLIIDQYSGPSINGIRMDLHSPNFTPIAGRGWTAMLVNALKLGSTIGNECVPSAFPGTYWAQSGELLGDSGPELDWADTKTSCLPQWFTTPTIRPSIGNNLDFQIQVDSSGHWVLYGLNVSTGGIWTHTTTVSGSTSFATNTWDTSVFFENPNPVSRNWAPEYNNVNPKIDGGTGRNTSTGIWDYWQAELFSVTNCYPGGLPISSYETGTLRAGTLTYNVANIQSHCATGP